MTRVLVILALMIPGDSKVPLLEATYLTRRPDLVGSVVAVEGRVRLFLMHPGRGFDQVELKETPVRFDLPPSLRFSEAPSERSVRIEGVLQKQGDRYSMEVRSLKLLPEDRDRLARALATIPQDDPQDQLAWTSWALRRAEIYGDDDLAAQARKAEAEAMRIQAESPGFDSPQAALDLAQRARDHKISEPIPSALFHRAFAALSKEARTEDEISALIEQVQAALPRSTEPFRSDTSAWDVAYTQDPFRAYRMAPEPVRKAYDRRLLADLLERGFKAQSLADPSKTLELSEEAKRRLPDRPEAAKALFQKGLDAVSNRVQNLGRDDLMKLVGQYDEIGQPEKGRALIRSWLEDERKNRISRTDAEGRVVLAGKYVSMLGDTDTAVDLLQEAWRIDPQSKATTEAFRNLGYRKASDGWVKDETRAGEPAREAQQTTGDRPEEMPAVGVEDPLLRLTPAEIVARLGKPDHKSQVVTQGIVTIQWVYRGVGGSTQYILFRKQPGLPATVVARYSDR